MPEYRVIFIWDNNKIDNADNSTLDWMLSTMRLRDSELTSRFVRDENTPDYIIATDKCFVSFKSCMQLKHYFDTRKNSIFIFFTYESLEPDLNIFDYAFTWNPDLKCGDRIGRNFPYMYDFVNDAAYTNTLTREDACKILDANARFCNFIYSNTKVKIRDDFFYLLSGYKRVDSLGSHLNNTGLKSTRAAKDWYNFSVELKTGYKFSIAMENQSYNGYTSEKIVSSLRAHTVPIYWGDPAVTEFINPKAFINCNDYSSFEEVVERVKEIDNNDELWIDIVTQPWQTEEQRAKTLQAVEDYHNFFRNIFSQDIRQAIRRPMEGQGSQGGWGYSCRKYFTGILGIMPPFYLRVFRKARRLLGKLVPKKIKPAVKKFLGLN